MHTSDWQHEWSYRQTNERCALWSVYAVLMLPALASSEKPLTSAIKYNECLFHLLGVGHCPMDEAPDLINPAILEFVLRHSKQ